MKKSTIRQFPLLFLFAPTLIAALIIYFYLNNSLQASYELQVKANARHVVARIVRLSYQNFQHKRFSVMKEQLQRFVQQSDSAIDNIVIYDKKGQFVTALTLNRQVLNSTLFVYPSQTFVREEDHYLAFGRITSGHNRFGQITFDRPTSDSAAHHLDNSDSTKSEQANNSPLGHFSIDNNSANVPAIGFVRVSFYRNPAGSRAGENQLVVLLIAFISIFIGFLLWRYRYIHFHQQLAGVNQSLSQLNKGFKHVPLSTSTECVEINELHQKINESVSFYEKQLTMNYLEVTALVQELRETGEAMGIKKAELEGLQAEQDSPLDDKAKASPLLTTIYRAAYVILQSKLAVIDNSIVGERQQNPALKDQVSQGATESDNCVVGTTIAELNQLLNEVKRVADISAGQLQLQFTRISSEQLVNSISRLVAPLAHTRGIEFIIAQPAGPLEVDVDVNQVQRVLITLLQSAIDMTSQGYVKLVVELTDVSNHRGITSARLRFKVQDSGIGFSLRQYNMLVDDQIDQSLFDDDWICQGLSLLVAKKNITAMGGEFTLKSLPGLGSELSVELRTSVSHYQAPELHKEQSGSILVYDPVVQSGDVIFNQLCEQGVLTILCVNEEEVHSALQTSHVDCAVFCRPVALPLQQVFDQSVTTIVALNKLEKCLFLSSQPQSSPDASLALPQSWKHVGKPFVLSDLTRYFDFSQLVNHHQADADITNYPIRSDRIEILAVDDNETNLKLLSVILRPYPVNLVQALSGREALVMSQKQVFDLILMDKEMPQMDGLETSRHIRTQALNKKTPIIAFTAHLSDGERHSLIGDEINDCMEKPLDQDKFYGLMETWCKARWDMVDR
ncbi:MAG: CheY-like chemotaxis protein/signal transduction histidine kinase [Phenylobacterium sp.]|jgi:CheY-like chemotaxis protein/signal transduction histidine kinase